MSAMGEHSQQEFMLVKGRPNKGSLLRLTAWYVLQNAQQIAFTLVLTNGVWKELQEQDCYEVDKHDIIS